MFRISITKMIPIVCVDNSGGMLFNNRRQSRDSVLNERILSISEGSGLYMNEYSFKLFEKFDTSEITVNENFLDVASDEAFCFVENKKLSEYIGKFDKIIIFKWNREYPADYRLDINLKDWKLEKTYEFQGNSHEKITEEIYVK